MAYGERTPGNNEENSVEKITTLKQQMREAESLLSQLRAQRKELHEVEQAVGKLLGDLDTEKRDLESKARTLEERVLETVRDSKPYKWFRDAFIVAITIGLAVWFGGAIVNGIQVASVIDMADETKREIQTVEELVYSHTYKLDDAVADAVREISEDEDRVQERATAAANKIGEIEDTVDAEATVAATAMAKTEVNVEKTATAAVGAIVESQGGVATRATGAVGAIEKNQGVVETRAAVAIASLKDTKDKAVQSLEAEATAVSSKLMLKDLPDLPAISTRTAELNGAQRELFGRSLLATVNWPIWLLVLLVVVLIVLNILLIVAIWRRRIRIRV